MDRTRPTFTSRTASRVDGSSLQRDHKLQLEHFAAELGVTEAVLKQTWDLPFEHEFGERRFGFADGRYDNCTACGRPKDYEPQKRIGDHMTSSTKITSAVLVGIEARLVDIFVDVAPGLAALHITGLPGAAMMETKYRVQASLRAANVDLERHIQVQVQNLPEGASTNGLDLPIAVAILVAVGKLSPSPSVDSVIVGELNLNAQIRSVRGVHAIARLAKSRNQPVFVPFNNRYEAQAAGADVWPLTQLHDLMLTTRVPIFEPLGEHAMHSPIDFADIRGQADVVRQLEIAAAGGFNVLLIGPPGSGKTMLARRLTSILPPMTKDEQVEVTEIHSAAGLLENEGLATARPFRAPHHTVSSMGMIGDGRRPGEVSLAHNGVLLLDEVTELPTTVIQNLDHVMASGMASTSTTHRKTNMPACFMLVAATTMSLDSATKRLGRLMKHFDLIIHVPSRTLAELSGEPSESSAAIAARVETVRAQFDNEVFRMHDRETRIKQVTMALADLAQNEQKTSA